MTTEGLTIYSSSQIPCYRSRSQPAGPREAFPSWKQSPDSATHSSLSPCQLPWQDLVNGPVRIGQRHLLMAPLAHSPPGGVWNKERVQWWPRNVTGQGIFPTKWIYSMLRPQSSEIAGLWRLVFLLSQMLNTRIHEQTQGYPITLSTDNFFIYT